MRRILVRRNLYLSDKHLLADRTRRRRAISQVWSLPGRHATLNIQSFVYRSQDVPWDVIITPRLIFVLRHPLHQCSTEASPSTCTLPPHALDILVVGLTPPYYCPSDFQGVANCYMLANFARSHKRLATPYLSHGKPSRGARQRLPVRTFRTTSTWWAYVRRRLDLSKLTRL